MRKAPSVLAAAAAHTLLAVPLLAVPVQPLQAASDSDGVAAVVRTGVEDDADGFSNLFLRGGALFEYRSHLQYRGFAVQNARYSSDGWSDNVPGIVGLYRNQRADTLAGLQAEFGLVSVSGHARPVGDVTWTRRPRASTGIELLAAADVVGTRAAIERGISYGLLAASVEQQFGERVTGILLAGWQPFTDGNARALWRGRTIVSLLPEEGLTLQARWRQYRSRENDVDGAYFNPRDYRNWDAGLALRRRIGSWTVAGLAGAGRERAEQASWQTTAIAELRAEGPLSGRARLSIGVLYSRAAGFAASDDYWYGTANVSVILPLAH